MNFLADWERRLANWSEDRFFLILLSLITILIAAVVTAFALDLHYNFLTIACDTAAFQNSIVNTLHANWFRDTAYDGPNLLGLHTMFVVLLLAPLYALFPSPHTLFALQIWGVYGTVIPLYLVARLTLGPRLAFLIAGTALISPMMLHMALAPADPQTWFLAAALWSYFFFQANKPVGFWISFAFAMWCGEQASLIFFTLGLVLWTLRDKDSRSNFGRYLMAASFAWAIFAVFLLLPLMRPPQQHNLFAYHYENWGIQHASDLPIAAAEHPLKTLGLLLSPSRWLHVASLVGLPLLFVFFSWRSLILLLPFPFYFLMTDQEFFLYFHAYYYQFAFLAGFMGLLAFFSRWNLSTRLGQAVLSAIFVINLLNLCGGLALYMALAAGCEENLSSDVHEAFAHIPLDAGVYSPHRFSAYLSNRTDMVLGDVDQENLDFDAMIEAQFATTNVHANRIDFIVSDLINDQCGWRQAGLVPDQAKHRVANLKHLLQGGHWQVAWNEADVIILQRVKK